MRLPQKMVSRALLGAVLCHMAFSPAFAAPAKTPMVVPVPVPAPAAAKAPSQPDPNNNTVLSLIMRSGGKLYYLGNLAGLDGWLIIKEGQTQMAYTTPDGQHALVGAIFGPNGEDMTADQVDALMASNPEVKTAMTAAAHQAMETDKAQMITASQSQSSANADFLSPPSPVAGVSSGEQLYQEMGAAKGVMVGKNPAAPLLFMIIDPNCPHCQATWRALRESVFKNTLQVRLIPIGTEDTPSELAAAQLLRVPDPLNAWNKYVDGDKTQLATPPDPSLVMAVKTNHILVDNWNLHATPILVYRGKDGKVKIEQGEPENVSAILSDLGVASSP